MECQWIVERCKEFVIRFPALKGIVEHMPGIWSAEVVHWNALGELWRNQHDDCVQVG